MTPRRAASLAFEPAVVLVAGTGLWALLVVADRLAASVATASFPAYPGAAVAATVLVEEVGKALLILLFAALGDALAFLRSRLGDDGVDETPLVGGRPLQRWPGLALSTVVVFATAENISYLVAFPGSGIFARLFWALPIHVGTAMALVTAVRTRKPALVALAFVFALAWHISANLLASATPTPGILGIGAAISLTLVAALARPWLGTIIVEGSIHGTTRKS